jgi:hypothetical protein
MARWWKCDLQVATPREPRFRRPDGDWDLETEAGREVAAGRYMKAAAEAGLEVLALADHNSIDWVDVMVAAGRDHGVVVLPGFEVTSGTGADGVHAIILGGPDCTQKDFAAVLYGACGFDPHHHPLFNPQQPRDPAPSPRTLPQILDALPDSFLVIAPHVFGDNGLASERTLHGSLRWKALHHDRLGAVDVGDPAAIANPDSWKARFVRRELDNFPCLPNLAFVSTSDAYSLDQLGSRYTWIRMAEPTLEALRQAFLDPEARIACDWDPRYCGTGQNPNTVSHAWVERVTLTALTTTPSPVTVTLDPRLTVLIGGRGAGKSTVVAGLRCLYGDPEGLPPAARAEARQLLDAVFSRAVVAGTHHLAHSGEAQTATWTVAGSETVRSDGQQTPTDFKVRVISQKELFERAANTPDNPYATSRNLLVLVDDALAVATAGPGSPDAFEAALDQARTAWVSAARQHQGELSAVAQRAVVAERVTELRRQVAAFDNEANRARRSRNDRLLGEARWLDDATEQTRRAITELVIDIERRLPAGPLSPPPAEAGGPGLGSAEGTDDADGRAAAGFTALVRRLEELRIRVRAEMTAAKDAAISALDSLTEARASSSWQEQVAAAAADSHAYLQELAALGLDPTAYGQVRAQLQQHESLLADLDRRTEQLPQLEAASAAAWNAVEDL